MPYNPISQSAWTPEGYPQLQQQANYSEFRNPQPPSQWEQWKSYQRQGDPLSRWGVQELSDDELRRRDPIHSMYQDRIKRLQAEEDARKRAGIPQPWEKGGQQLWRNVGSWDAEQNRARAQEGMVPEGQRWASAVPESEAPWRSAPIGQQDLPSMREMLIRQAIPVTYTRQYSHGAAPVTDADMYW